MHDNKTLKFKKIMRNNNIITTIVIKENSMFLK